MFAHRQSIASAMQRPLEMCRSIHLTHTRSWSLETVPVKLRSTLFVNQETVRKRRVRTLYYCHIPIVNVEGGTRAWQGAGLPVVQGKKILSLERQVRIATGALVLIGAVLGWIIHPAFIGISALVGAGLVFSGITDSCAMGMLLAKMPWNQISQECENGQCSD